MSTVEEFERKMESLAGTNGAPPGRWVLVPRKEERFVGSRDRNRMRVRRRRRQVFSLLVEATGLTLLIGLFPPLRLMLVGTVVLFVVLLLYAALLVQLKADEATRARLRARRAAADGSLRPAFGYPNGHREALGSGTANGNGSHAVGNGRGHLSPGPSGHGHGHGVRGAREAVLAVQGAQELVESGVRILDDVHVVVRRRVQDAPELAAATR